MVSEADVSYCTDVHKNKEAETGRSTMPWN